MDVLEPHDARTSLSEAKVNRFEVGPISAKRFRYDAATIDALPIGCTESFAGVGDPLAVGPLEVGERVVDFGSGAGLDALLAARAVA